MSKTAVVTCMVTVGAVLMAWWMLWSQRCPRCKSIWGPKGVWATIKPEKNIRYTVRRRCRKCAHEWTEEAEIDPMA